MVFNRSIIFTCFFIISSALVGQEAEFTFFYKIENEQFYIRWMPNDLDNFRHAIEGNMTLDVFSVEGTPVAPEFRLLDQQEMKPMDYAEWRANVKPTAWDSIAIATVHAKDLDPDFRAETFIAPEYEDTPEEEWFNRFGVSNYAIGYEWSAIERSGLGISRPLDEGVGFYAFKLYPTASGDTLLFDINVNTYKPAEIPELTGKYKDRVVDLQWRTLEFREHFFGWYLDRSQDGGKTWEAIFDLPLINNYDTIVDAGEALKYLYKTDYIPEGDVEMIYRLQGADYLGGRSSNESILERKGNEDITLSPLLTKTIQTDSNYAVIQWEYDEELNYLLEEFRIVVTDTTGNESETILEGLDPTVREAAVFMKYRSNFYRVQAVSKLGTVYSSFESLVMMYDVEPPAMPTDFTGYVDSTGLAHLSWVTSNEVDLAGYYLFKGYFKDVELAMMTPDPLSGPTHIDTIDMETGNELVYYQLRSVDFRGNGSAFTPILTLKKPDVFPPASSRILKVDNDGRQVRIEWGRSPSPDVETYRLYRRIVEEEEEWSEIYNFNTNDFQDVYIDSLVELGKVYAYTMQVTDDDGLLSDFCQPVSLKLKDYGVRRAIDSFSAIPLVEEKAIQINWEYASSPREYYLYRGHNEQPLSLLKVIAGDRLKYKDQKLRAGSTYRYVLRAYFVNGNVSPYTEELEIILE